MKKCLSVKQPWAELIIRGDKPVENRTWSTAHRGELYIAAAKSRSWWRQTEEHRTLWAPSPDDLAFGAIIGAVTVVDCLPLPECTEQFGTDGYAKGPWCWVLTDPRRLSKPIPIEGKLRLFNLPSSLRLTFGA